MSIYYSGSSHGSFLRPWTPLTFLCLKFITIVVKPSCTRYCRTSCPICCAKSINNPEDSVSPMIMCRECHGRKVWCMNKNAMACETAWTGDELSPIKRNRVDFNSPFLRWRSDMVTRFLLVENGPNILDFTGFMYILGFITVVNP